VSRIREFLNGTLEKDHRKCGLLSECSSHPGTCVLGKQTSRRNGIFAGNENGGRGKTITRKRLHVHVRDKGFRASSPSL
jgi:hypothetical protein